MILCNDDVEDYSIIQDRKHTLLEAFCSVKYKRS